mgnify:CR=1 FL=1
MSASPIKRVVYFAQTATVQNLNSDGTTNGSALTLPVSTANIEVTRPIEAITSFGKFGSLNTAQTNLTTCKSTLKCYLGAGTGFGTSNSGIDATFLQNLTEIGRAHV